MAKAMFTLVCTVLFISAACIPCLLPICSQFLDESEWKHQVNKQTIINQSKYRLPIRYIIYKNVQLVPQAAAAGDQGGVAGDQEGAAGDQGAAANHNQGVQLVPQAAAGGGAPTGNQGAAANHNEVQADL